MKRSRGPTRRGSLGVLVGGLIALVVAGVLRGVGQTDAATSLFGVAAGVILAGAVFTVWTSSRSGP